MKLVWSLHKLANLLDNKGYIGPSNSPTNYRNIVGLERRSPSSLRYFTLTSKGVSMEEEFLKTSQANQVLGIFVLIQEYT
jgi:hypothetical protein